VNEAPGIHAPAFSFTRFAASGLPAIAIAKALTVTDY
jgi:hypothetical protein